MLSIDEALGLVLAEARAIPAERLPIDKCLGLVLAQYVTSDVDSPPHDKSTVDGYAIRSADPAAGIWLFEVVEEVAAGRVPQKPVAAGQATRVMTGAPVPTGADAVVMHERSEILTGAAGERIRIAGRLPSGAGHVVTPGQNILPRGASLRAGDVALAWGGEIRPIEIGILAELGRTTVEVIPRPRVAVLSTGNELVSPAVTPEPGQIRDSNGPMLLAAAARLGCETVDLGIAGDDAAELERRIARGLGAGSAAADVLLVSGGVSAGLLDLVPDVLARLGVERVFHKVNVKPGKPLWFGVRRAGARPQLVFGLPGNPVSSLVCFELFARPAIARLAGHGDVNLKTQPAQLAADFAQRGDRPTYHPAVLGETASGARVEPLRWRGSGDLATLARANALAIFPAGDRLFPAGTVVEVIRL